MRSILAVVALLVFVFDQDVSGQKLAPVERIKDALSIADTLDQPVPVGPKDEACKAFWKMSSYEGILADFVRLKIKNPELKKALEERVRTATQKAAELLHEKARLGEKLGCGGKELSDSTVLAIVGPPSKPVPAYSPSASAPGKKPQSGGG